jgi:CheY-like chemotaxis protein/HPt (histidine-containing phosphotransfer) domain-containing protein
MCEASAAEKGLPLTVETDPALPTVFLGDPTRLTQILLNLLNNAIKFTKQGYIRLQIDQLEDTRTDSRVVRFVVEDTGIGIAAPKLSAIFERFQQADNSTTRFYGGTGLGLHIVKALTELQGGTVSVTSVEGQGSRFVVELPYAIGLEQIRMNQPPLAAAPIGQENVRVLVVEDNLMNQRLVHQVLNRLGYQVQLAENGQRALQLLADGAYDIILMDLQMPVMDGYETTRLIRSHLKLTVPIIAMTAHALPSEKEDCLKAGMNDFLSKPFQMADLQQVLRPYLPTSQPIGLVSAPVDVLPVAKGHFSAKAIQELVNHNMAFVVELLEVYLKETPPSLITLQQALDEQDLVEIKRLLHMQKVHTKTLAMGEATRLILEVEELTRHQKGIGAVGSLVEQYIQEVKAVLPAISQYVQASRSLISD